MSGTLVLGRSVPLPGTRTPSLLCPIPRAEGRRRLGLGEDLPFYGEDLWTGYELSWLDANGKPEVCGLRLRVPCRSPNILESKSLKLYLNGLAQDRFADREEVRKTLLADLGPPLGGVVGVELLDLEGLAALPSGPLGESLDGLELGTAKYARNPLLLHCQGVGGMQGERNSDAGGGADAGRGSDEQGSVEGGGKANAKPGARAEANVAETWHTHLFRSLCPVTGQPDWASLVVAYRGPAIAPHSLLAYLVSYRCHAAFHEEVIEQIFLDIQARCIPERLTVSGHFLRRGGLDINPFRSTEAAAAPVRRLPRQ